MPARCSVAGCNTKAEKGSGPRFYCIPSEINFTGKASPLRVSRRKKWIQALKLQHLQDHQLKNIRICGHHFVTGKPADQYFVQHPDWVPSLRLNKVPKPTSVAKSDFFNQLNLDGIRKVKASSPVLEEASTSEYQSDDVHKYSMPQKRCCVLSCLNRMSKTKNSSPPIYYHKFPEDSLSRSRWIFLCQKKGTWEPDHCYICSEHFTTRDYKSEGKLKELSVPTKKLTSNEQDSSSGKGEFIFLEGRSDYCSVPWCKSSRNDGKIMELFPDDAIAIKRWIDNIYGAQVPVVPFEKAVICQDHFENNQWIDTSEGKILKENAIPTLFNFFKPAPPTKEIVKRRSEIVQNRSIKKEVNEGDSDGKIEDLLQSSTSSPAPDKVIKVVRVVKRTVFNDHTYSGKDAQSDNTLNNGEDPKKRKMDQSKNDKEDSKRTKIDNFTLMEDSDDNSYNNIEELMADLMGESLDENKAISNNCNSDPISTEKSKPKLIKGLKSKLIEELKPNYCEDPHDYLDDYSDYSETDSDSDSDMDNSRSKSVDKLSEKELKELAEAQKFQLDDLKSENKELIDENERLRNELNLLKTDPDHASLNLEKSKFMKLIVKLLRNFLNTDQILCLIKANDPSTAIVWSSRTLKMAHKLNKACTDNGYDVLVDSGFPLPPRRLFSMLDRDKSQLMNLEDKEND